MDKMIFNASQAAKTAMARLDNVATNMANVNSTGFRSQLMAFRSAPMEAQFGSKVRAYGVDTLVGYDFTPGPLEPSSRPLDAAIDGQGFFAVQSADGTQGYTRSGSFSISPEGFLVNNSGQPVLGNDDGPINIPAGLRVEYNIQGTVMGFDPAGIVAPQELGVLKRVNPNPNDLVRREDGLFVLKNGQNAQQDDAVVVVGSALEASNSNATNLMVQMIEAQRYFDHQMQIIETAESTARAGEGLLSSR